MDVRVGLSRKLNAEELMLLNGGVGEECFPGGPDSKMSACNAGDLGLTPGSGISPREGNSNPLQYSYLENSMDGGG